MLGSTLKWKLCKFQMPRKSGNIVDVSPAIQVQSGPLKSMIKRENETWHVQHLVVCVCLSQLPGQWLSQGVLGLRMLSVISGSASVQQHGFLYKLLWFLQQEWILWWAAGSSNDYNWKSALEQGMPQTVESAGSSEWYLMFSPWAGVNSAHIFVSLMSGRLLLGKDCFHEMTTCCTYTDNVAFHP